MSGAVEGVALLPCPFCDWPAKLIEQDGIAWVECIDCACEGPPEDWPSLAAEAWNTRTTPLARSYADEDVARIIDPNAWAQREHALMRKEHWERNPIEGMPDFVAIYAADAEQLVAPSLAKAAAIRLLSQGEKA